MLNSILSSIFGSQNMRIVRSIQPLADRINSLEPEIEKLSDAELKEKTSEFRERLSKGEKLEEMLPEAFACVREASRRTIKLRHFDVQLIGGVVLHQGKIAEMRTGEGKTLVATLPIYLNALPGKGVHLVTVNDYLAKRDRFWMGPIFEFLGLTVGYIEHDMDSSERQKMYACDVTYVTNNELGFDYLRDNMAIRREDRVLRGTHYAIVDEVDSILIDEARTPLIISGPAEESTQKYFLANRIIPSLKGRFVTDAEEVEAKYKGIDLSKGFDFIVDEKAHNVTLTEQGVAKCERLLNVANLYDDIESEWVHHLTQALRAHNLFKKDVDYVVKDGEVIIVDEFTGRLMPGRRWSEGLHQAVEAKENVRIAEENQTLATVTFQNFFRMYGKIAGMTGTAATEEEEFFNIYKLAVVTIPTNKPMIRIDNSDVVYRTEKEKWLAIVDEIETLWKKGQPVLVGTRSIEKNEKLSAMLRRKGIPHQVLNAKYHEQEAQIIAQAGKKGSVTVATNMAGRGVDIVLGGNPPDEAGQRDVIGVGGLHVLGTERHESRRIDNQLRGRTGRQGDIGSSRFYVALDDELMRLFGGERMSGIMEKLGMRENENIEHPWITRAIANAQKKVEAMNFDIRKHLLDFDNVMGAQREAVYSLRNEILEGEDISQQVKDMISESVEEKVGLWATEKHPEQWDWETINMWLRRVFNTGLALPRDKMMLLNRNSFGELLEAAIKEAFEAREKEIGAQIMRELERFILLQMIDTGWREHLYELDQLRKGINLRAYGQKDPLIEYKMESSNLFSQMMHRIRESTVEYIFKVRPRLEPIRRAAPAGATGATGAQSAQGARGGALAESAPEGAASGADRQGGAREPAQQHLMMPRQKRRYDDQLSEVPALKKLGRNDPCPCGSGKKYKKCCGK